jgi:hypothetical protein
MTRRKCEREKIIAHVLAEMSAGIPLSKVLGPDREPWLCSERCFWKWYHQADVNDANGLVQKVARARDCGVEARIERALEMAETPMIGEIVTMERDPELQKDIEDGMEPKNQAQDLRPEARSHLWRREAGPERGA